MALLPFPYSFVVLDSADSRSFVPRRLSVLGRAEHITRLCAVLAVQTGSSVGATDASSELAKHDNNLNSR